MGYEFSELRSLFLLMIACFLGSCSSPKSTDSNATQNNIEIREKIPFSGCWLSEDYFKSIQEFKSSKKAQSGSLFIPISSYTGEQTMMIYNFHEGGSVLTVLKGQDNYELCELQDDSVVVRTNKFIKQLSAEKIKVDTTIFVKINPIKKNGEYLILEEILFKGQYLTDSGQIVEFKNNGQVKGLNEFTYYSPIIDYFDAGMQVDQVSLGTFGETLNWFGFQFFGDTLKLYKLNCLVEDEDKRCVEVENGPVAYTLIKRKD